jgi:hypothetical protein
VADSFVLCVCFIACNYVYNRYNNVCMLEVGMFMKNWIYGMQLSVLFALVLILSAGFLIICSKLGL